MDDINQDDLDRQEQEAITRLRSIEGRRAGEWPDSVRELAFELWAYKHAGNCEKTAEAIAKGPDGYPVPARTIREWATAHNWAERKITKMAEWAPAIREQVVTEVIAGSIDAIAYVRAIVSGEEEPDKVRLTAAMTVLDRFGVAPHRQAATDLIASLPPKVEPANVTPRDNSPAAAAERIRLRRQQWQEQAPATT